MKQNKALALKPDISEHFKSENVQQALDIANQFFKAGCFGGDVKNPHQAFVKIQAGREMGMPPMEAMKSLYIVNGQITIYGSAMTKRLREAGWKIEYLDSTEEKCTAIITKNGERYEYTATKEELLKLKSRAFGFAPKEKLRWHAISRLVRFNVPEILGAISYTKEEMDDVDLRDTPPEVEDITKRINQKDKFLEEIAKAKTIEELKEIAQRIGLTVGLSQEDIKEIRVVMLTLKNEIKPDNICKNCKKEYTDKIEAEYLKEHGICLGCEKSRTEAEKAVLEEYPLTKMKHD